MAARRYHHGDLPSALVQAGVELARAGGPAAVGLREVARSVGVTPNAVYRHFADRHALVVAVAARAQLQLARTMERRMAEADHEPDEGRRARRRLREVGLAYVEFAVSEPGWFSLAFFTPAPAMDAVGPPPSQHGAAPPYRLLLAALDDLVTAGVLPPDRRPNAEWACWSSVHGLAELATRGPLRGQDPEALRRVAEYVVDRAVAGILAD